MRHQRLIRKTDFYPTCRGGNRRVRAINAVVTADGFDPVEIVGVSDFGGYHIAQRSSVADIKHRYGWVKRTSG